MRVTHDGDDFQEYYFRSFEANRRRGAPLARCPVKPRALSLSQDLDAHMEACRPVAIQMSFRSDTLRTIPLIVMRIINIYFLLD